MTRANTRTRVACKNCNARRVRCHRPDTERPCANCQLLNVECELIDSKRGKYKRASAKAQRKRSQATPDHSPSQASLVSHDGSAETSTSAQATDTPRYASPSLPALVLDRDTGNGDRVVYMGDSNNMKYLIHQVGDPFKNTGRSRLWGDNLQQSLVDKLSATTHSGLAALRTADEEHLRNIGALNFPGATLREELIAVFFDQAYAFFPLFDRLEFTEAYEKSQLSPLLLNALFCVAAIHCSEHLIRRLGYDSRYLACSTFYHRAKALHEKDYETDGVANVQASLLLMNWWQGPMEQKDTWYWLGVSSSLAQALGMHRIKSYHILRPERQKLWRRIWWVLFINDVHHAAVFGRPPHIHSHHADVTALTIQDMTPPAEEGATVSEADIFLLEHCRLAIILDKCLMGKFSKTSNIRAQAEALHELKNFSPTMFGRPISATGSPTIERGFYPALLGLIHYDYLIVVERMLSTEINVSSPVGMESYFISAGAICRILEDLLSSPANLVVRLPYVAFPAVFCSILIQIICLRRETGSIRLLAEHRARLAMMVADQLQDRWPFVVWTRHLLDALLKNTETATQAPSMLQPGAGQDRTDRTGSQSRTLRAAFALEDPRHTTSSTKPMESSSGTDFARPSSRDHAPFSPTVDGLLSPVPFMFPWNGLLEDLGDMDQWLL